MTMVAILASPGITWVAAPPFLPPGRGGLILITGGLSMLAFALLLLSMTQQPLPSGVTKSHSRKAALATTMHASAGTVIAQEKKLRWPDYVTRAARAEGLSTPKVLDVQGTVCTLLVERCRSCRRRNGQCRRERRALLRAARRISRHADVQEVSCNIDGRHACAFQVRMRGSQ